MKLRLKTITIFIATTIILIGILNIISETIILNNFEQLEQTQVNNTIGQLQIEFTNELFLYQTKADSWALKKDIYNFVLNESKNFDTSAQTVNSLASLGMNYVLLYDSSGKYVAGFGFNLSTYRNEPVPDNLISMISSSDASINTAQGAQSSVAIISKNPVILVSSPIQSSSNPSLIQGVLVLARYIDSQEIATLSRSLQLPVSLKLYSEWQKANTAQAATFSQPLDTNYIVGYCVIRDLNNQPAFLLGITMHRTIYVQGVITVNYIDQLVLVSSVVFSVTVLMLLEFSVLSKLSRLTHAVTKISQHKNPSERLPTKGNDEIETLTQSINKMLGEIESNNEQLQVAQRFSAIGELATMVAHDLRNPLQAIAVATFYLKRKVNHLTTEKEKEMLKIIEEDVRYSDKIVNDLLDYSRNINLDLQEASPRALIWESLSIFSIPENIQIIDETTDEPKVKVDVDSIKRVFANLISNAFDAMSKGGTLTLKCQLQNKMACFTFHDTGEGINSEIKQKIFQPLFTTKAKGMGFGLSICKRIIDAHGGKITVDSNVGEGSIFSVYLPLATKE